MAETKGIAYENAEPLSSAESSNVGGLTLLQRKLKARHVQMIAIGSNVGTGLFIGSGRSLHTGGPLALIMGYILITAAVSILMYNLAEMATVLPVSGSFTRYSTRFLDKSIAFSIGIQYWLAWVSVFAAEASAFRLLINFWNQDERLTPLWISIFVIINLMIHVFPVRVFGEVEFYVSALKVVTIVVFIIVTWAVMGGAGPNGQRHGADFWHLPGLENGLANGFKGLASVFANAAFAMGGAEIVGIVAGETQQPRFNLPRATRTLLWRLVIFYIISTIFLSFVVPYDDDNLIGAKNANSSPFVIAIRNAGIRVLPDILNAVLLVFVCSVGSSGIYISSRTLHAMAEDGLVFSFFARTDRQGRPYWSLLLTAAVGIILAYLNCSDTGAEVFTWFSAISGMAFLLVWLNILTCSWRFHAALRAQNDPALRQPYAFRSILHPWASIFSFAAILFMVVCQFIVSAFPIGAAPSAQTFFANFISVPIFLVLWLGHWIIYRPRWKRAEDIDLQTNRLYPEHDPEEQEKLAHYHSLSFPRRVMTYMHF